MTITSSAKTLVVIAVTCIGTTFLSQPAKAASMRHIDNLAVRLQGQARELIGEFRLHYRHTGDYRHLISDSYQMYQLAAHIHSVTHHGGSLYHVRNDVNKLDSLFHHLEGLVRHMEQHSHGGHIHGDTRHVRRLLARMEDTLHHLQEDVEAMTDPHHGHGVRPIVVDPGFGHLGHSHSPRGFRIGNGHFSIRIGR